MIGLAYKFDEESKAYVAMLTLAFWRFEVNVAAMLFTVALQFSASVDLEWPSCITLDATASAGPVGVGVALTYHLEQEHAEADRYRVINRDDLDWW